MNKNDKILRKLENIESAIEEIYEELISMKKYEKDRSLEQIQIMTRIENIADFIQTRYNVVIEEKEKFVSETIENNSIL